MRFIELPLIHAIIALIEAMIALIEVMIVRAREMRRCRVVGGESR
jgi:hypothetical protein